MFATAQNQPTRIPRKETGKLWSYFRIFIEFTTVCALCSRRGCKFGYGTVSMWRSLGQLKDVLTDFFKSIFVTETEDQGFYGYFTISSGFCVLKIPFLFVFQAFPSCTRVPSTVGWAGFSPLAPAPACPPPRPGQIFRGRTPSDKAF